MEFAKREVGFTEIVGYHPGPTPGLFPDRVHVAMSLLSKQERNNLPSVSLAPPDLSNDRNFSSNS